MDAEPCTRRALARGRGCVVERCACGHLHVTVGPVTLRVDEGTLEDLSATLRRASCALAVELHGQGLPRLGLASLDDEGPLA